MEFRQLTVKDTKAFSELIQDMYSHLDNIEWFLPMAYDDLNVQNLICDSRYYILGAFEEDQLIAVSSLDYQCSEIWEKVDLPADCNLDKLIEVSFSIVHSAFRGHGYMKTLVEKLNEKILEDGYEYVFSKAHRQNYASLVSLRHAGFEEWAMYQESINKFEIEEIVNSGLLRPSTLILANMTLTRFAKSDEVLVKFIIMLKKLV